ncbi:hypothetical protein [Microaerobacter geothermalis]|nr:hypothetical protein [Microaerobacter geothermalis]
MNEEQDILLFDESNRFFKGLIFGIILSIPIWVVIVAIIIRSI